MDEAFKPLSDTIVELVNQRPVVGGDDHGQRIIMTGISIELPVELDVTGERTEGFQIGSTPPLYPLRTSVLPSFHQLRLRASLNPSGADE